MQLGAFSLSLAVKDLAVSRAFYEKLGFAAFAGAPEQNWLMMRNGPHVIGLFQGMFEKNTLTFNPGWDQDCELVHGFTDVRTLQAELREAGLEPSTTADPETMGPAFITLEDPDGNPILIDQHV
jgi:lactoylglutathione lyase